MAIRLSDDKELVEEIDRKLKENKEKYGKAFCPCVLPSAYTSENSDDYVCMCKEFRDQIKDPNFKGFCHCMLYYKD